MKTHGKGTRTIEEEVSGIQRLLNHVSIDIVSGKVVWTNPKARRLKPGDDAGSAKKGGYWEIKFDGVNYRRHRIVFYVAKGYLPLMVDHVHGVECGDGIDNLQEVTNQQNTMKQRKRVDNSSGFRGVSFNNKHGKWYASINENGKRIHLGCFASPEEASNAYETEAKRVFGKFYNGI